MSQVIAYIRSSTDKQDIMQQEVEILSYANINKIHITSMIKITMSSKKSSKERLIDELCDKLKSGDTLIVTELSRLGRSTPCVIKLVNDILSKDIRVIVLKQGLNLHKTTHDLNSKVMVTMFSLFAEMERDIISQRTKSSLASKKAMGIKLGKPKGTIQNSMYDKDLEKIKELLAYGISVNKLSQYLGYKNNVGLNNYILRRGLRNKNSN